MGNATSTEANRRSLPVRPLQQPHHNPSSSLPSNSLHPLPLLHPLHPPVSLPNKLTKPKTRRRSTADLLRSSEPVSNTASRPSRFSTHGTGFVSSFASSKLLSSPLGGSRSIPAPPVYAASPAISSSVFTFEEAVASYAGPRASSYWQPVPSDTELFPEQQAHQQDFQDHPQHGSPQVDLDQPWPHPEDDEAKRKQRRSRRGSLFRTRSLRQAIEPDDELASRRCNSIGPANPSTGDWYRTWDGRPMTYDQALNQYYGGSIPDQSVQWPPAADIRTSWNYDLSSYEAQRLLHIVNDTTPLDYRLEQSSAVSKAKTVSEVTWKSSHPIQDDDAGALNRVNSDLSLYAPSRRRSMAQIPGVATRRNSVSSVRAGGPVPGPSRYRFSVPGTPSMSRQASVESFAGRVPSMISMPPMPPMPSLVSVPLAAGPSVPPMPPVLAMPPLPSLRRLHDASTDTPSMARVATPCDSDYKAIGAFKLGSLRITNGEVSPMSSPEQIKTPKAATDRDNARRRTLGFDFAARTQALAALSGISIEQAHDSRITESDMPSPLVSEDRSLSEDSFLVPREAPIELPQIEISSDIFAGFEFSLFSFDDADTAQAEIRPLSATGLQTTSKHTAMEDDLFGDEEDTSEYHTDEVLNVRLDPNAKSSGGHLALLTHGKGNRNVQTVSRSDSGFVSSPASDTSSKPLNKADSGYSSNVSLRSFKHAASKFMGPKAATTRAEDKEAGSPATMHSAGPPPSSMIWRTDSPLLSTPSPTALRSSPVIAPAQADSPASQSDAFKRRHPVSMYVEAPLSAVHPSGFPSPDTPNSVGSGGSASSNQRSHRLRRLFYLGAGGPSNSLSVEMERGQEHAGLFPGTAKRLTVKSQVSKDTLKTIFSVGSLEGYSGLESQASGSAASLPATTVEYLGISNGFEDQAEQPSASRRHTFQSAMPTRKAQRRSRLGQAVIEPTGDDEDEKRGKSKEKGRKGNTEETTAEPVTPVLHSDPRHGADEGASTPSASARAFSRAMSLTSQLERGLNMRLSFPWLSSPSPVDTPTEVPYRIPSPSLPSPLFAEMLERQRTSSIGTADTPATPMSARKQQKRPPMLCVQPPARPQSTPVEEQDRRMAKQRSCESIYNNTSPGMRARPTGPPVSSGTAINSIASALVASPTFLNSPSEVSGRDGRQRAGHRPSTPQSHGYGRSQSMLSTTDGGRTAAAHWPLSPSAEAAASERLRHRSSSYDSLDSGWVSASVDRRNSSRHRRSGSASSTGSRMSSRRQQQQQQQFPLQSPPYVPRGYYQGNGPQAPYRILHSYNSPAYRGAPIWG